MFRNPIFAHTGSGFQLILFMALVLFGALLSILAGILLSMFFFGLGIADIGTAMQSSSEPGLLSGRLIQVISQLGMFVLPPLIFALMVSPSLNAYLGLRTNRPCRTISPRCCLCLPPCP